MSDSHDAAADGMVNVEVMTMAGDSFQICVEENATVWQAKQAIEEALGLPAVEQRLLEQATILDDDLKPFREISARGATLQVLRVPRMGLQQYLKENGRASSLTSQELEGILSKAARKDEADVCLEIVCHNDFGSHWRGRDAAVSLATQMHTEGREYMLEVLSVGGLARPFIELVNHEMFGQVEGMLDVCSNALHLCSKRGLVLHCEALLGSPHFHAAAARNASGGTVLHHAANNDVLQALLAFEALSSYEVLNARDRYGCTCLHYATSERVCRAILQHPMFDSVNTADEYGQIALHNATNGGICTAILEHPGFTMLNAPDNKLQTPLHTLARREETFMALMRTADLTALNVDAMDKHGRTALFNACSSAVCSELFKAGFSEVNAVDHLGRTALHACKSAEVARSILEHPDFNEVNARGGEVPRTALEEAARTRRDDVVLALLRSSHRHDPESIQNAAAYAHELGPDAAQLLLKKVEAVWSVAGAVPREEPCAETQVVAQAGPLRGISCQLL
eukprot:gb/GFBE01012527.1/.p1 GENE.gb/GFBE01012527.1/~~gb/GFBE01012527.1/.p1  ORF type:complete len:512 (+),score=108.77 gb/GFBE01012527.1/:1-1536(+)